MYNGHLNPVLHPLQPRSGRWSGRGTEEIDVGWYSPPGRPLSTVAREGTRRWLTGVLDWKREAPSGNANPQTYYPFSPLLGPIWNRGGGSVAVIRVISDVINLLPFLHTNGRPNHGHHKSFGGILLFPPPLP